jgi:hypothetical protein
MDKSAKKTPEAETEGGFDPDRPEHSPDQKSPKKAVGPLPTDDPHGRARQELKAEVEKETKPKE